jgi:hypothetical protein
MKKNTLVHTHQFGPGIELSLLHNFVSSKSSWDFNLCFLVNPILYNLPRLSSGKTVFIITEEAVGDINNKDKYIGNHSIDFELQTSIYDALRYSISMLYDKFEPEMDNYYLFSDFQYSGGLEKMEIYTDNTIKIYLSNYYNSKYEEDDLFVEAEKYAIHYYGVPPRAKGYRIYRLLEEIFGKKGYYKIETVYKEDRAIFSIDFSSTNNKYLKKTIDTKIEHAFKIGVNISKIGEPYNNIQEYLIVDESGVNFKELNVFEETLEKVGINPMDIYFKTENEWDEDIFSELLFLKSAPVYVFQKKYGLTIFEKEIKKLLDIKLPMPFTGMVQITYNNPFPEYEDDGTFLEPTETPEINYEQEIHYVNSANTIKDILENVLQNEDGHSWVRHFRYINNRGVSQLLIYLGCEENDFIKDNNKLYDALIKDGYVIKALYNNRISFEKGETEFMVRADLFEPLIVTVSYFNSLEAKKPLTESQLRAEMLKFLPGLADWNCIPAVLNERSFTMVVDVFNAIGDDQEIDSDLGIDAEVYAAESLKFLYTQKRSLTYKIPKIGNPVNQLVLKINQTEKNVFGKTYFIKDVKKLKDTLGQNPKGFDQYTFQNLNILIKANGMPIGNIILWKYEQTKDNVDIEYSIQKTSKELIMNIPLTKSTQAKKKRK